MVWLEKQKRCKSWALGCHCLQVRDMSKKQEQTLERNSSWQRRKIRSRHVLRKKGTGHFFITFCKPEVEYLQRDLFHWQSSRLSLQAAECWPWQGFPWLYYFVEKNKRSLIDKEILLRDWMPSCDLLSWGLMQALARTTFIISMGSLCYLIAFH